MPGLNGVIDRLIQLGIENELIENRDMIYCRNQMLGLLGITEYKSENIKALELHEALELIADYAVEKGLIEDTLQMRDVITSRIINTMLDKPSLIEKKFKKAYSTSPESATSYFYNLSRCTNYVKVDRIAKNKAFLAQSPYGSLQITINLSKPEKDPKEIAKAKEMPQSQYPVCLLCIENEGYNGHFNHPDRANHRIIGLKLNEKEWGLQYSPYLYYDEHCILLSKKHEPMSIGRHTFKNLLAFVEAFPHYFMGSNADLPIVGGSILAHEHYQGGKYDFPISEAEVLFAFHIEKYKSITCKALKWPLTTIRLSSQSLDDLVACSDEILGFWKNYSHEEAQVVAYTGETSHNTITPVAHKEGCEFVMDLVLRNNRTDEEYPMGIFHPHEDVHHIKKENIGLIEVMGLAILPGRLFEEIEEVKKYVSGEGEVVKPYHQQWADELRATYVKENDMDTFINNAVGQKFTRVLEDAGVFKVNESGKKHFEHFIEQFKIQLKEGN